MEWTQFKSHESYKKGDVDQNYHFLKKSNVENDTLFALFLLLNEFFV